jgi:hypothetical protein
LRRGVAPRGTLQRAPYVRIYERGDELSLLDDHGRVLHLSGDSCAIARELLERLRTRREPRELLAGIGGKRRRLAGEVLSLLRDVGAVVERARDEVERSPAAEASRVVLALAGGIVAAHAPALTEMLLARGLRVRIAATPSALRFVSALALEALTHEPVVRSRWPSRAGVAVPHLELAQWADAVLVYPATATTLSRIARGDCSSVVSALAVSTRAPVILVPAMNEAMFDAPSVQRNLAQLRADGFILMHPSLGYEVAVAPSERKLRYGAAPTVQSVALVTEAVLRDRNLASTPVRGRAPLASRSSRRSPAGRRPSRSPRSRTG